MWTSLLIISLVFAIATSSVVGTGYAKKMSSNVFTESETGQNSQDTNQNIVKRIAELQKQINELRRLIQTIPQGPPGPPGPTQELVISQVKGDPVNLDNDGEARQASATCPSGTILTGGGFSSLPFSGDPEPTILVSRSAPTSSSTWGIAQGYP